MNSMRSVRGGAGGIETGGAPAIAMPRRDAAAPIAETRLSRSRQSLLKRKRQISDRRRRGAGSLVIAAAAGAQRGTTSARTIFLLVLAQQGRAVGAAPAFALGTVTGGRFTLGDASGGTLLSNDQCVTDGAAGWTSPESASFTVQVEGTLYAMLKPAVSCTGDDETGLRTFLNDPNTGCSHWRGACTRDDPPAWQIRDDFCCATCPTWKARQPDWDLGFPQIQNNYVTVDSINYGERAPPVGVSVAPNDVITFQAAGAPAAGFTLCVCPKAGYWALVDGTCAQYAVNTCPEGYYGTESTTSCDACDASANPPRVSNGAAAGKTTESDACTSPYFTVTASSGTGAVRDNFDCVTDGLGFFQPQSGATITANVAGTLYLAPTASITCNGDDEAGLRAFDAAFLQPGEGCSDRVPLCTATGHLMDTMLAYCCATCPNWTPTRPDFDLGMNTLASNYLTIAGNNYGEQTGPPMIAMTVGDVITFVSGNEQSEGFKLCICGLKYTVFAPWTIAGAPATCTEFSRTTCPMGTWGDATTEACIKCPAARWGDVVGATTEADGCPSASCPAGKYSSATGATSEAESCTLDCPEAGGPGATTCGFAQNAWRFADDGESCSTACASAGEECTLPGLQQAAKVATAAEVERISNAAFPTSNPFDWSHSESQVGSTYGIEPRVLGGGVTPGVVFMPPQKFLAPARTLGGAQRVVSDIAECNALLSYSPMIGNQQGASYRRICCCSQPGGDTSTQCPLSPTDCDDKFSVYDAARGRCVTASNNADGSQCPAGTYKGDGVKKCVLCPAAKFGTTPGTFTEVAGCGKRCPAGKYGTIPGQSTEADACPLDCPGGGGPDATTCAVQQNGWTFGEMGESCTNTCAGRGQQCFVTQLNRIKTPAHCQTAAKAAMSSDASTAAVLTSSTYFRGYADLFPTTQAEGLGTESPPFYPATGPKYEETAENIYTRVQAIFLPASDASVAEATCDAQDITTRRLCCCSDTAEHESLACPLSAEDAMLPFAVYSEATARTIVYNQTACPAGTYFNGELKCERCGMGKFGTAVGAQSETAACTSSCPAGRFGRVLGATSETEACLGTCNGGTDVGASVCAAERGFVKSKIAESCTSACVRSGKSCTADSVAQLEDVTPANFMEISLGIELVRGPGSGFTQITMGNSAGGQGKGGIFSANGGAIEVWREARPFEEYSTPSISGIGATKYRHFFGSVAGSRAFLYPNEGLSTQLKPTCDAALTWGVGNVWGMWDSQYKNTAAGSRLCCCVKDGEDASMACPTKESDCDEPYSVFNASASTCEKYSATTCPAGRFAHAETSKCAPCPTQTWGAQANQVSESSCTRCRCVAWWECLPFCAAPHPCLSSAPAFSQFNPWNQRRQIQQPRRRLNGSRLQRCLQRWVSGRYQHDVRLERREVYRTHGLGVGDQWTKLRGSLRHVVGDNLQ